MAQLKLMHTCKLKPNIYLPMMNVLENVIIAPILFLLNNISWLWLILRWLGWMKAKVWAG